MSKIKNYDRALYESIEAGLREVMKPYQFLSLKNDDLSMTYTHMAYEQAATFLCLNDIQHTFVINPVNSKLRACVVMVSWIEDDGTEGNFAWWEKQPSTDCYLVQFKDNWSDEMDVSAFALYTVEEYNNWCHALSRLQDAMRDGINFNYYFGTNEYNEYSSFKEFADCFTIKTIPADYAVVIRSAFDIQNHYGDFPTLDNINIYVEDMERYNGEN